MRKRSWVQLGADAWALGVEASYVIALRSLKIATGGRAADAELQRMVAEKFDAVWVLQARALTGGLGRTPATASSRTIAHYRRKVRANRRRLTKG